MAAAPKPPVLSGDRAHQVSQLEAWISEQTGQPSLAASFENYAQAHPKLSAKQAYLGWFIVESKISKKLGEDLGRALGGGGQLAGASLAALSQAFDAGILGWLGRLSQRNFWARAVKVIAGVALILIGAAQLTRASRVVSSVKDAAAVIA